jgi:F420-0:gamma-glutamyl ligase
VGNLAPSVIKNITHKDKLQDLIKETSKRFGDARIVVVASHAHRMYKAVPGDIIDFKDLRVERLASLQTIADVQASLQRYSC